MKKVKSSVSKARSYTQLGEYWDKHDLNEVWGKTRKVKFEVVTEPEATYYPIERNLSAKIRSVAKAGRVVGCPRQSLAATEDQRAKSRLAVTLLPVEAKVCHRHVSPPAGRSKRHSIPVRIVSCSLF
jgi:hypothetical protein